MENLYNRIIQFKFFNKLPKKVEINSIFYSFSKEERVVFFTLLLVLIVSTVAILQTINRHFMVSVPAYGGSLSEGIIGTPRFINPILAFSDTDQDLVALVYSGLMRKNLDGSLVPDLAEKYEVSPDGLSYTFTLKDNIYFHNDAPVTIDDIIFTINQIKDPIIKSPHRGNWEGVSVTKIDEKNIKFTLRQPYASFLENTSLGILPKDLWDTTPLELNNYNTSPIGSGPYMIESSSKESSGIINYYELRAFKKFALGKPHIKSLNLYFYLNETDLIKALKNGEIDQASSLTPENTELLKDSEKNIQSAALSRIFGLFFNQNVNQIFVDKVIVNAIDQAIDKDRIIQDVLKGYGTAIDYPIPQSIIDYQKINSASKISHEQKLQKIRDILAQNGWNKNSEGFLEKSSTDNKKTTTSNIEFSISTSSSPELVKAANIIKENLLAIGIKVDIKTFEVGNLNQDVIRPRKYEALLFGQIINNESDLYAFWHSSQRKDPGLNIAMYTNAKVDKILEDAFSINNEEERVKKYIQFEEEIKKDMPAIFLYSPNFIYVVSKDLRGLDIRSITSPSNRFANVYSWYIKTDNIWKIFIK